MAVITAKPARRIAHNDGSQRIRSASSVSWSTDVPVIKDQTTGAVAGTEAATQAWNANSRFEDRRAPAAMAARPNGAYTPSHTRAGHGEGEEARGRPSASRSVRRSRRRVAPSLPYEGKVSPDRLSCWLTTSRPPA